MNTVLITGGNRGIGLALVEEYLGRGWHVTATCRTTDSAAALAAGHTSDNLTVELLDVGDIASIEALALRYRNRPLDMLINNAGVYWRTDPLAVFDATEWQTTMTINLCGPVALSMALLPSLRLGKLRKIISISSALGSIAETSGGSYSYRSSKAALNMAMRNLAQDLAGESFIVTPLSPGLVDTDLARDVPRAKISPQDSARGLADVIDGLTIADSGSFLRHNGGTLPW